MADISAIVAFIDKYLERNSREFIDPVEANRLLARAAILRDSEARPGLPLRKLLRAGFLPHAYQPSGSRGAWRIPHSGSHANQHNMVRESPKAEHPTNAQTREDMSRLGDAIGSARERFRPSRIRCVLIGEAPPDSIDRFFYYLQVRKADHLFLGIMKTLYPALKDLYIVSGRPPELKEKMLLRFQSDGYYLLDVLDIPLGLSSVSLVQAVPEMVLRVKENASPDTPIVLIKATTYAVALSLLRMAGFSNVVDIRIPFPGQGWQKVFQIKFAEALKAAKLR
jgi:hypothetical protein